MSLASAENGSAGGPRDFIFYRELAEVYLLLDNISTTLGKSLPAPRAANPAAGDRGEPDWVSEICDIGWPPQGTSQELNAQAATLIRARDRLNSVAAPATGFTIAFTLLVAGEQMATDQRARGEDAVDHAVASFLSGGGRGEPPPSRFVLANIAYPGLRKRARAFNCFKFALLIGLFAVFVLTSVLSWNIATGNALMSQLTTLESAVDGDIPPTNLLPQGKGAAPSPTDDANKVTAAQDNLDAWSSGWNIFSSTRKSCSSVPANSVCPAAREQWASTFLGVLGGAVLPIFYGLLGAGVSVVRALSDRLRDSRLAPRHFTLFIVQLVLGAVLGGCVGLFATPSSPAPGQTQGFLGAVPLSASALAFLAGFSVEGVFQALDSFIRRVFNLTDPAKPPQPQPPQLALVAAAPAVGAPNATTGSGAAASQPPPAPPPPKTP